jgi:hypothetical protein
MRFWLVEGRERGRRIVQAPPGALVRAALRSGGAASLRPCRAATGLRCVPGWTLQGWRLSSRGIALGYMEARWARLKAISELQRKEA